MLLYPIHLFAADRQTCKQLAGVCSHLKRYEAQWDSHRLLVKQIRSNIMAWTFGST